ncbi:MAG: acetyl-CoA hydrolase/transferase C-terminal domain-containing protein, partial [Ignavibacteria bacterium]|nr:acetyl-CoA hydrolase/transferase C-terminal domain-containing protein [Ignavibacteria bacterium]
MKWIDSYNSKLCAPKEAVKAIESGMRVYVHPGCATPEVLLNAMCENSEHLSNVEVIHLLTLGITPYSDQKIEGRFRHNALFIGANVRKAVNEGRADYTPIFLYEIPNLFYKGILPIDVSIINVSPPDKYGFCSYGVGIETTKAATESAKIVIAQINPNQPRTLGDSFIHIDKIDYCVEVDAPLNELKYEERLKSPESQEIYQQIGKHISTLIENGSTLQLGIGAIPEAVLRYLFDKKDLGLHTEMFSDGVIKLVEKGIITNEKKTLHPGKIIASFVLGTKKLFDFIDNNPLLEFHPTNYTNDPFIIAQNEKMVAINSAIEIDLTGQVCSDSIGTYFYSGFGGQLDFIRGASRSKGGKPIIAIPSTARNGKVSKIVPYLSKGAGVTTTKGDVHFVVTEYGIADLYGKTLIQRAKALIDIAHPNFRDELDRFVT